MSTFQKVGEKMTNFRWIICGLLFFATTVNYLDRQVLSLTWKDFIAPEFHWTDSNYGDITAIFSIVYAIANLFAGRFIDWMGTKKGYLWAIFVWSLGACLHALCGWATEETLGIHNAEEMLSATGAVASTIAITSVYYFTAPITIPPSARYFQSIGVGNGWEMAFIVIGGLGFIWMGLWMFLYKKPNVNPRVNAAELEYIEQDNNNPEESAEQQAAANDFDNKKISFLQCFKFPQTWAVFVGKFMTDGVWWFFLFWTPAYISDVYGFASDTGTAQMLIFVLYAITMLSIYGGKLPTIIINKTGKNPYAARMQAMLIFALFPLLALFAQPLGNYSYWYPIIIIGIAGAAHQSWSANIYSVVGDMFPKSTIATIVGIGGMAGGIGSFCINMGSGRLFDYAAETNMTFMGFEGKPAGYFIIFCVCAVAYLVGWIIMKALVPKYKPVDA